MKKLLLLLLCVPLIFSCGEENNETEKTNTGNSENKCDVKPDYSMSMEDFLKMTQTSDDKFYGKIFEIKAYMKNRLYWGGMEVSKGEVYMRPQVSFHFWELKYQNQFESDYSGQLTFDLLPFSQEDEDYWNELEEIYEKNGDESVNLKIKGILDKENSSPGGSFFFKNCCIVIPNQKDSIIEKDSVIIQSPKINEIIEQETSIDTSEMEDIYRSSFIWGVINDPDGYTNVREEKSSKSEIVFKVYEGEKFEIINSRDENWWLIEYNEKQGYIYSDRIDIIQ